VIEVKDEVTSCGRITMGLPLSCGLPFTKLIDDLFFSLLGQTIEDLREIMLFKEFCVCSHQFLFHLGRIRIIEGELLGHLHDGFFIPTLIVSIFIKVSEETFADGQCEAVIRFQIKIFDIVCNGNTSCKHFTQLNKTQRQRRALPFLLLVEFIPVKEVKRLTHPRLRRVIVETVCCGDSRTGKSIEGFTYPVVLPLRKGLLHNVTQSIECEVDLPSLETLILIAVEEGKNDVVVIGCREPIFVRP
jgi:hypothetical protein